MAGASTLLEVFKKFSLASSSDVEARVAFVGFLIAQRHRLDGELDKSDLIEIDDDAMNVYTNSATQILDDYKNRAFAEIIPDLTEEIRSSQIEGLKGRIDERSTEVISRINERTDFKSVLFANIVAWAFTLIISLAIISLFLLPNFEEIIRRNLEGAEAGVTEPQTRGEW